MRTSCIQHPANSLKIVIHQWQVDMLNGDTVGAQLLSFFEYWHNIKLSLAEQSPSKKHDDFFLQRHTEPQLEAGVMVGASRKKIRAALNKIYQTGIVTLEVNPHNPHDRTKHFLYHPDVAQISINAWAKVYEPHQQEFGAKNRICIPGNLASNALGQNADCKKPNGLVEPVRRTRPLGQTDSSIRSDGIHTNIPTNLSSTKREESPYPLTEESGGSVEPAALIANRLDESNEDTPPPTPSPQQPEKPILRSERAGYVHPARRMEERFSLDHSGGETYHPAYSDMEHWGVEWVWDASKGNRLNGWSDEALNAATAQLRKTNQPAEIGDACRWLAIRVNRQRWSELDLLKPESQDKAKPQAIKRNPENITGSDVEPGFMHELDLNHPLHRNFQKFLELARRCNAQVEYNGINKARIHFWVGGEGSAQLTWCQRTQSDYTVRMQKAVERREARSTAGQSLHAA